MYPTEELEDLVRRKAVVQARIRVQRWQCTAAASRLAEPVAIIDRAVAQWRKVSPFVKLAAIPAMFLFKRRMFPGKVVGVIGSLIRWAPLAFGAFRAFKGTKPNPPA